MRRTAVSGARPAGRRIRQDQPKGRCGCRRHRIRGERTRLPLLPEGQQPPSSRVGDRCPVLRNHRSRRTPRVRVLLYELLAWAYAATGGTLGLGAGVVSVRSRQRLAPVPDRVSEYQAVAAVADCSREGPSLTAERFSRSPPGLRWRSRNGDTRRRPRHDRHRRHLRVLPQVVLHEARVQFGVPVRVTLAVTVLRRQTHPGA